MPRGKKRELVKWGYEVSKIRSSWNQRAIYGLRESIAEPCSSEASKGLHIDQGSRPRKITIKKQKVTGKKTHGQKRKLKGSKLSFPVGISDGNGIDQELRKGQGGIFKARGR